MSISVAVPPFQPLQHSLSLPRWRHTTPDRVASTHWSRLAEVQIAVTAGARYHRDYSQQGKCSERFNPVKMIIVWIVFCVLLFITLLMFLLIMQKICNQNTNIRFKGQYSFYSTTHAATVKSNLIY